MKKGRRRHTAEFKARVAFAALKSELPLVALASKFAVHPTQIAKWKRQLLESGAAIFGSARERCEKDGGAANAHLLNAISRLQMEEDWLKKKVSLLGMGQRRDLLEPGHGELSIRRQCELLSLSRSAVYYKPRRGLEQNVVTAGEGGG